jgi:hypothetical protein
MICMTTTAPANYDLLYRLRTPAAQKRINNSNNPCEVCGKELDEGVARLYAVTDQGDYPIGSTCLAKVRKAGIPVDEYPAA